MSRLERSRDVVATIARLAAESFAGFELDYDPSSMSWKCRHPHHGNHAFRVYFQPGLVAVWGDLGEFMFRHGASDSLQWFLDQGHKDEKYPDYFLGKLRAVSGDTSARDFYVGDAYAYIDERVAELRAEWNDEAATLDPDDDERHHLADAIAKKRKPWEDLRVKFKELLDEQINEERTCWYVACVDVLGDSDPPACTGWTSTALWVWHAARTFARLHAARAIPQPVHTDGATEAVS